MCIWCAQCLQDSARTASRSVLVAVVTSKPEVGPDRRRRGPSRTCSTTEATRRVRCRWRPSAQLTSVRARSARASKA